MKNKIACCCLMLVFCFFGKVKAQNNDSSFARLITNLRNYYELNPQEKCFIHTDKSFYQPGESIYVKAYLTLNNTFSSLSNVIYTDLSDKNGKLIHKGMWRSEKGLATASIFIPDTIQTGIYCIRSYSLWMLNEPSLTGEQYIFIQGKKDQAKSFYTAETAIKAEIFPEGGQLILNTVNRMAFRVTNLHQLPLSDAVVELVDENKQQVALPFVSENGIGMIEFTPVTGKTYQLAVKQQQSPITYFQLPAINDAGLNLKVENLSLSKIFVQANASDKFIQQNGIVYVLAQQNGNTVYFQKFNLSEQQNASVISKKNLYEGLMQVAVFDSKLQPLAERWIWVQLPHEQTISLATTELSFAPKSKNSFTLSFNGADTPNLSVAVIPADLPEYDFVSATNIKAYQNVHSNHTGKRFVLNSFEQVKQEQLSKYLDALTLTIQPSRFKWQDIMNSKQPDLAYFFETGISLRGFVKKDKQAMDYDSSKIDIITKGVDSSTIFSTAKVSEKGAFAVNDLHFMINASVSGIATTKEKKKRKIEFDLLPSYIDTLGDKLTPPFYNPTVLTSTDKKKINEVFIKNYSVSTLGKELTEIVVTGKSKSERYLDSLNNAITTDNFRNSEFTKVPDTNFSYVSFAQLFEQEFFGFRFNTGYARISGLDGTASTGLASADAVSYYLNEMPIDPTELNFINPSEVILIKVNRNENLHLGQTGLGPSVLIYTKNKGLKSKFGLNTNFVSGYSIPIKFRSPDYSKTADSLQLEDRRTTLLWQPSVKFDKNGIAVINFYNNSYTKRFKVIVQGMDRNGKLYYMEKILE